MISEVVLLVNFGGPRNLEEIAPFLRALLTDRDVIRTPWPNFLHNFLFSRIAKKRALKIAPDYELIGGKSPIFEDTETIAKELRQQLGMPVVTFHRYLPATHAAFLKEMEAHQTAHIRVFPLFPQFSYATTGSIARWMQTHLPHHTFSWVRSYPNHPAFVQAFQEIIASFLRNQGLSPEDIVLLYSAHGVPQSFINEGDSYQQECELSFKAISAAFPQAEQLLCYQSKVGRGEWLRPYTVDVCSQPLKRKKAVVIPLSFTSDHIETLFEIESQYLPLLRAQGIKAYRCPALNLSPLWLQGICNILRGKETFLNAQLIRN